MALLTADWILLGRDRYYRKFEIYSMNWQDEVNVNKAIAVVAPYGGPVAVMRDRKKLQKVPGGSVPSQFVISVFSGSGRPITSIKCGGRSVVKVGWTNKEELILIQEDGKIVMHNIFNEEMQVLTVFQDMHVLDAIIFTNPQNFTGIAVMTKNFKVQLVNNVYEPIKRQLSEFNLSSGPPTSWSVVSEKIQAEVLVSTQKKLYRLKQDEHFTNIALEPDITNQYTQILEMAVSFNARHIALLTDSGYLWLGSSDFRTKYAEVETGIIHKPKQLVWCGTEAVVAFWEQDATLLLVGRHGEKVAYTYDSSVWLAPEIDGVRVLSTTQHELLQKVPDVVQKIFRMNSTDPGSFLLEASKQFQKRSHRADEYISLVKDNLLRAVEQCIDGAGYEFDPIVQKMLIRAAQFGKCFISNVNSDEYVGMCRLLRVLNAIRDPKIGIPLTFTELQCLSNQTLLDRLVARKHYYLAIQISKYLKLPNKEGSNRILIHWAKHKVSKTSPLNNEQIAQQVVGKLGKNPCISYADIAQTASDSGRKELAIKLLDYESKASEQVKLLVNLEEYKPALVKAIESGDSDLIYDVVLKIKKELQLGSFKLLIHNHPAALALYIKYCRKHDLAGLKEILNQEDDWNSQAQYWLIASLDVTDDPKEREDLLASAAEAYKKSRNDPNGLNYSLCEENVRLMREQKQLEEKYQQPFVGKSVHETCKQLLMKDPKRAEKFRGDFKIPEKRYWSLRVQVFAQLDDWIGLEKFSNAKKSPIGYAPFVDICLMYRKDGEVMKYLPRVVEELKVKYYVKANKLDKAADIAAEQRDMQGLLYVQSRSPPQSELSEKINNLMAIVGAKK